MAALLCLRGSNICEEFICDDFFRDYKAPFRPAFGLCKASAIWEALRSMLAYQATTIEPVKAILPRLLWSFALQVNHRKA